MSDIKIYGKLKSGVTTKALVDAAEVAGGFMSLTTDEMNSLSDALKVEGMLVYCTSDSKFYQLKESKWAVALQQEQKTIGEVVTDVSFSGSQSVSLVKTLKNIETGAYSTDATPVPTAHQFGSGLMSASDYNLLQTLSQNVQQLQGSQVRLLYTDSANPLQSQISSFVSSKGYTDYTGISVVIDATQHVWRYYSNDNIGWKDDGLDIVTTFTNDTAGIVKGSTDNGKINAESDGTGFVNGWSDLTQRVANVESQATVQNLIGEINLTNKGTTVEKQDNSLLVKSTCKINNHDNTISTPVTAQFNVPIKAGSNITFTEATDKSAVVISATASAEVSQPDYDQNDSTASDYIKNRPFYEDTKTAFGEVFNKTLAFEWSTTSNVGNSNNEFNGSNPMGGIRGEESVTVIFNGVEYNLTTQDLPNEMKEEIEAYGGTGFVAGAPYDLGAAWQPTSDFPFTILYYGADDVEGETISALIANTSINQASIPVIVKAVTTTTELHTINPKYIKDMYYETTTETGVYSGTLTTTASGSSYKGEIPLTTAWAGDGDTAKVIIDNVEYLLPVKSVLGLALAAGDVDKDGIKIQTLIDTRTEIFTKTQYTGASFSLGVIKTDIHKIPDKYVPLAGKEIKVSASEGSTTSINNAIKEYLNNNVDDLNYLKTAMNFVLIVDVNGTIVTYEFSRGAFSSISACSFVSLTADNADPFDPYPYTNAFILNITLNDDSTVNNVVLKNVILLNSSTEWTLMVVDTDNDTEDNNGLMGIAHLDKDTGYYKFFNGSVSLHSWITKAQQRSDFQIPTPTKPTDLVDKQYADSAISNAITKTLNTEV